MTVHNFDDSLRYGEDPSHEPFWDRAYRIFLPEFNTFMLTKGNTAIQHAGQDRIVALNSGRLVKFDEKKRARNRNDFLLEYLSARERNTPGWIEKDLDIDYIGYAFMPARKVYFLPWHLLRLAWKRNRPVWIAKGRSRIDGFVEVEAKNVGYTTVSIAVPQSVLFYELIRSTVVEVPV